MGEEIKILCVDDEQNILNVFKRVFLDNNYMILCATSGQDGLKMLEQEDVQIVISDYRMPVMNGIEFLKEVCKRWPQTVRIMLSGYADTAAVVSAINEGQIYKFIPKPWNDDELKVTISNAIERYLLVKKNAELTTKLKEKNAELARLNDQLMKALVKESKDLKGVIEYTDLVLADYQDIFNTMLVGVCMLGMDDVARLCNSAWANTVCNHECVSCQGIRQIMPEDVIGFIEEVKGKYRVVRLLEINGVSGTLTGVLLKGGKVERDGVILVFSPHGVISE